MADAPLAIVLEMVTTLIEDLFTTLGKIIGLFQNLLASVGIVSSVGGPVGFVIAVAVVAVVGYFIGKMVLGAGARLLILVPIGMVLAFLLVLGAVA